MSDIFENRIQECYKFTNDLTVEILPWTGKYEKREMRKPFTNTPEKILATSNTYK